MLCTISDIWHGTDVCFDRFCVQMQISDTAQMFVLIDAVNKLNIWHGTDVCFDRCCEQMYISDTTQMLVLIVISTYLHWWHRLVVKLFVVWWVCFLLAGLNLWKRMPLKCSITMVFTCPLLSLCTISSLFRENNNVVVFPFPFHIFMPLANMWFILLQG
jgi:hypothetical protein